MKIYNGRMEEDSQLDFIAVNSHIYAVAYRRRRVFIGFALARAQSVVNLFLVAAASRAPACLYARCFLQFPKAYTPAISSGICFG